MSQALKAVQGVVDAEVSFDTKRAEVHYDPEMVAPEKLVQAVNDAGFGANLAIKADSEGVGSSS